MVLVIVVIPIVLIFFSLWLTTLILGICAKKKNKKIICQDCEKEVGKEKICPHCGNPNIKRAKTKLWLILHFIIDAIGILGLGFVASSVFNINIFSIFLPSYDNEYDPTVNQVEIIADYINIRSEKDVNSEILGKVREGEYYTIISEDTESKYNWIEIKNKKGVRGFIAGKVGGQFYVNKHYFNEDKIENEESTPDNNESETEQQPNNTLSPREKLHNALIKGYYVTYDNNTYSWDYSMENSTMMRQYFLNEGYFTDYSDYLGMQMLSKYDYKNNVATFIFKWSSYWANIEWNLNTERWNCESSVNNWCQNNGQEYVDGKMTETIDEVWEMFNKAGITREEAIQ